MILDVRSPAVVRLRDASNFSSFKIVALAEECDSATVQENLAGIAQVEADGSHAFVAPAAIHALAGTLADDDGWCASFAAMTAFAVSKGWSDAEGRIRAHIEPANSAAP
jgi:hypothetical protein